jgi:hypothetical protein
VCVRAVFGAPCVAQVARFDVGVKVSNLGALQAQYDKLQVPYGSHPAVLFSPSLMAATRVCFTQRDAGARTRPPMRGWRSAKGASSPYCVSHFADAGVAGGVWGVLGLQVSLQKAQREEKLAAKTVSEAHAESAALRVSPALLCVCLVVVVVVVVVAVCVYGGGGHGLC